MSNPKTRTHLLPGDKGLHSRETSCSWSHWRANGGIRPCQQPSCDIIPFQIHNHHVTDTCCCHISQYRRKILTVKNYFLLIWPTYTYFRQLKNKSQCKASMTTRQWPDCPYTGDNLWCSLFQSLFLSYVCICVGVFKHAYFHMYMYVLRHINFAKWFELLSSPPFS